MKWLEWLKARFGFKARPVQNSNILPSGVDEYHVKEIYLGYSGELRAGNLEICFSCSVRDGVLVNIKTISKWKILFEFCDGNYLINDDRVKYTNLLAKLKELREMQEELDSPEAYEQLQAIVIEHLAKNKV